MMNGLPVIDPSIVVAMISLLATLIVAFVGRQKVGKTEAVAMENRITTLETESKYFVPKADCATLTTTISAKLDQISEFFKVLQTKMPQLLLSPHTEELDALLKKVENGPDSMTAEETGTLIRLLDENYLDNSEASENKRLVAIFVRAALSTNRKS